MKTPTQTQMSKALIIALFFAILEISASAQQQTTQSPEAKQPVVEKTVSDDETPVMLSAFTVETTQDKGYTSISSATGFKTDEPLLKIPQMVTVVTRDMIDDIGASQSSDTLRFAGVSNFYRGDSYAIRGQRIGALLDEGMEMNAYADNVYIDSYEVLRGTAALFYGQTALGGVVLKTTRKPMPNAASSINFRINEYGGYRTELDNTGPLVKLGDGLLSYRVVGAWQGGESFFKNHSEVVHAIHPSVQYADGKNKILIALDYQHLEAVPFGANAVAPDGSLYIGAGRDETYQQKNSFESRYYVALRAQLYHQFTPNWESKTYITYGDLHFGTVYLYSAGLNWATKTQSYGCGREYEHYRFYSMLSDITGKYKIFGLPARTTAGLAVTQRDDSSYNFVLKDPSTKTFWADVPLDHPNIDSFNVPTVDAYKPDPAGARGSLTQSLIFTGYFNQSIEIFPERLTLVGGLGWKSYQTDSFSGAGLNTRPLTGGRGSNFSKLLYRVGAVYEVIKGGLSIFALESTLSFPKNPNARDANGALLPDQLGKDREVGVKTELFEGKLVSSIAVFNTELSNTAVFTGYNAEGKAMYVAQGKTIQEGFDLDLSYRALKNWQIVGTYYKGTVKDQTGAVVGNSFTGSFSLFTRYDFTSGKMKGLSVGGGTSRITGRLLSPTLTVKADDVVNIFAVYNVNKHFTIRVSVDNLLDRPYVAGAQASTFVDPGPPRTTAVSAAYKF